MFITHTLKIIVIAKQICDIDTVGNEDEDNLREGEHLGQDFIGLPEISHETGDKGELKVKIARGKVK